MKNLVKNFDKTCEHAEVYSLLVINLNLLLEKLPLEPSYDDFEVEFTNYALSLISPELKEEAIKYSLETYPDSVKEDKTFMDKIKTIGIQIILTKLVYKILCNNKWKFSDKKCR
jgi:hypothetical protein